MNEQDSIRFLDNVQVGAEDGDCWIWTGPVYPNGYGKFVTEDRIWTAHRFSWVLAGNDDTNRHLDQKPCQNRLCVNPKHICIHTTIPDEERLWANVDRSDGDDGCWLWLGKVKGNDGMGRILLSDKREPKVNRYVWEIMTGERLGRHQTLYSTCKTPGCVNPSHWARGTKDNNEKLWSQVEKSEDPNGCWLWTGRVNQYGYGRMWLGGHQVFVHRHVWEQLNGPIPETMCVCHKCDVRNCVAPHHLFVATTQENTQDKMDKGRHRTNPPKGEAAHNSKLTEDDVREIRATTGMTQIEMGKKYGVHSSIISEILSGKRWSHVT